MTQGNFNHLENQHRCIPQHYQLKRTPPYHYRHVLTTFYIMSRNYGWGFYKGILYNLNLEWQANHLIQILIQEGFITVEDDLYTIHDEQYIGYRNLMRHHLLFHLGYSKMTPLTPEQCKIIDECAQKSFNSI
jgi:hypothetical protein